MALEYPDLLPGVFAAGAINHDDIPDSDADTGRMAWDIGFPSETSQPIAAGGIPPRRLDMNGFGNRLSQHVFWQQSGGLYAWDAGLDYPVGAHILGSNGVEYIAVAASGPSQAGGAVDPVSDVNFTRWKSFQRTLVDMIYPVGSIYMSVNDVNPAAIFGGTWQAITGKFLLAANGDYPLGAEGGSRTTTISVSQLPAHTHTGTADNYTHTHDVATTAKTVSVTTGSAGSHTHDVSFPKTTVTSVSGGNHNHNRGTMNITGGVIADNEMVDSAWGCFYDGGSPAYKGAQNDSPCKYLVFDASRTWTGLTSDNGNHNHKVTIAKTDMTTAGAGVHAHTVSMTVPAQTNSSTSDTHNHTLTIGTTGGGAPVNIMPPYLAVNVWKRTA